MEDKNKKQVPLRLSSSLYNDLAAWAEQDFRSVNGQIEFLLHCCVLEHKKTGKVIPSFISETDDNDL